MDNYTITTKQNLEERFRTTRNGVYFSHQPVYGYRHPCSSSSCISRYMITHSILNALGKHDFQSFADIGGAEGYTANLVKEIFRVDVTMTDLSENACIMAGKLFGIKAVPSDIHHLPFKDQSFDVVLCSETLEHVTDYKMAIHELLRVTRNTLIITVPHESKKTVDKNIRNKVPHGHIHAFSRKTLDYLKQEGYEVKCERTLSPLLLLPRVLAEGGEKPGKNIVYKAYNYLTPFLKKLFGLKTANFLTNMDARLCKWLLLHQGLTFTIRKVAGNLRQEPVLVKASMFTNIGVEPLNQQETKMPTRFPYPAHAGAELLA